MFYVDLGEEQRWRLAETWEPSLILGVGSRRPSQAARQPTAWDMCPAQLGYLVEQMSRPVQVRWEVAH